MPYIMRIEPHDNSGVKTRQVRRQKERLAKKYLPSSSTMTRADLGVPQRRVFSSSKYMPHIGKKERGRYAAKADA